MSTASDKARHRCTNPKCDSGPKGNAGRAYGYKQCRTCRMIAAVKRNVYNAAKRGAASDESFRAGTGADADSMPDYAGVDPAVSRRASG